MNTLSRLAPLVLVSLLVSSASAAEFHLRKEIPIGGDGAWDYLSVDAASRKLYLAQSTRVVVVDLENEMVAGEISGTVGVHGFALAPELGRGWASDGKASSVSVVELSTLKTLARVATGENPDAIAYDPGKKEVFAFNGKGRSATVIDAESSKVVATIGLPGKPEFAAVDSASHRVYVNIEDLNQVLALDTENRKIVGVWKLGGCDSPTGLAIDLEHHHLFAGCGNGQLVLLDAASGKVLSSVPIDKGVDATAFDPGTGLVFASCGAGSVTIARESDPGQLTLVQKLETEKGAKTMALDTKSHRIYLPIAKYGKPEKGAKRPPIVPGSIKLRIYEQG
jgi:hypothetical protein